MRRILLTLTFIACSGLCAAPAVQAAPTGKTRPGYTCKKRIVRTTGGGKKTVKRCWKTKKRTPKPAQSSSVPVAQGQAAPPPDGIRGELRTCANTERAKIGLAPLRDNLILDIAAQAHALDMKLRNYFAHDTPNGKSPFDRIDALFNGINPFSWMGENIAKGFEDAASTCEGWMNSPGHRANILRPQYDSIGTGWIDGYAAQEFGGRG